MIAGYLCLDDFMGAPAHGSSQLYTGLSGERPSWSLAVRKALDSKAPPDKPKPEKSPAFKEVDIYAAVKGNRALRGMEGTGGGQRVLGCPSSGQYGATAVYATPDADAGNCSVGAAGPARRRAAEAGRIRRRRNAAKPSFLNRVPRN